MTVKKVKWKKRLAFALIFGTIISVGLIFLSYSALEMLVVVPVLTAFFTGVNIYLKVL